MSHLNDLFYRPQQIQAQDLPQVVEQLQRELWRISNMLDILTYGYYPINNVAPDKVEEGMVRFADGTNWNPGSGKGIYAYYNGTWNKGF